MNTKVTQKFTKQHFRKVIYTGYCNLQNLLNHRDVWGHTERVVGWGADIYDCGNGVCIVTGYAPFGNVKADYDLCRQYDQAAEKIKREESDFNKARQRLDNLLADFVGDVLR